MDESGDLGFTKKSTKFFVVAYLECDSPQRIRIEMSRTLKHLHQKKKYSLARNELKFSRMDEFCRKFVLKKLSDCKINLGIVVMNKAYVNGNLQDDPCRLYNWCVVHNIMLSLLPSIGEGNKFHMVFDKSLPNWRIKEFNDYVENKASYLLFFREKGFVFT